MGGLLDATNVIPTSMVLCSALTAVDLDHQAFLGTVAQIARHKARIARPGRPFVLRPQNGDSIQQVVEEVVFHAGGTLLRSPHVHPDNGNSSSATGLPPPPQCVHVTLESFPDRPIYTSFPLQGDHQLNNLSTTLGVIHTLLLLSSKPISKSLANADPDLIEMVGTLDLALQITPETIERGIQVQWPGRLSLHHLQIPMHPLGNPTTTPLPILADGAHNRPSAHTLRAYISRLQSPTIAPITYILALSHSPPKTPHDTLTPILAPVVFSPSAPPNLKPGIALLPFTPPVGMPWVRPVDPHVLHETVVQLFCSAASEEVSLEITNQVEIRIFDVDTHTPETTTAEPPNINTSEGFNRPLVDALRRAAARHQPVEVKDPASQSSRGLVAHAGSLYLIADLYRLLERGFGRGYCTYFVS